MNRCQSLLKQAFPKKEFLLFIVILLIFSVRFDNVSAALMVETAPPEMNLRDNLEVIKNQSNPQTVMTTGNTTPVQQAAYPTYDPATVLLEDVGGSVVELASALPGEEVTCTFLNERSNYLPPSGGELVGFIGHYFVSIDQTTGDATEIKPFSEISGAVAQALTFDPNTNTLFGIIDAGDPQLISIDAVTQQLTIIGAVNFADQDIKRVEGLAFNPMDGLLYGSGGLTTVPTKSNILMTINPETGLATEVASLGELDVDSLIFIDNKLYAVDAGSGAQGSWLYTINQNNGAATLIGEIGFDNVNDVAYNADTATLFGFDRPDRLLTSIEKSTGQGTMVGPTHTSVEFDGQTLMALTLISPAESSQLTIIKEASIEHDFVFSGIEPDQTFTLRSNTPQDRQTFTVAPGKYTIKEDVASFPDGNWSLTSVACDGNSTNETYDATKTEAYLTILSGEEVTCTFLNENSTFDNGDSNLQKVYLPLVLRKETPSASFPVYIGDEIAQRPVVRQGEVFYNNAIQIPEALPSGGQFFFSSRPDEVDNVVIDDQLVLLRDGQELFAFDFSLSGTPQPVRLEVSRSIMEQIAGQTIRVEYRDIYDGLVRASPIWLIWVP